MFFQHPKRDSLLIAGIFCAVLAILFSLPGAIRFVQGQNARAAMGTVEVQLSPDERAKIEKEIVANHTAIQSGNGVEGPSLAQRYTTLGELYEKLGYLLKAKEAYEKGAKQDLRSADIRLQSARVLIRMKDYEAAKKTFDEALAVEPYNWKVYDASAQAHATVFKNPEEARGIYLKGLVATANTIDLMRAYAAFLESQGFASEAHEYRQEILKSGQSSLTPDR